MTRREKVVSLINFIKYMYYPKIVLSVFEDKDENVSDDDLMKCICLNESRDVYKLFDENDFVNTCYVSTFVV